MTAACPYQRGASVNGAIDSLSPAILVHRVRAPRTAGEFHRPPTCRIARDVDGWVLELDAGADGWRLGTDAHPAWRKTFASLMAAIDYAVTRGWRYRVVHSAPPPAAPIAAALRRCDPP